MFSNKTFPSFLPSFIQNLMYNSLSFCSFRAQLPEYVLDFGYVVLGTVRTHVVHATNTGPFPVSFQVEHENIRSCGFHVELDRVRDLPGAPDHETVDFVVSFDPRGANLQLGPVETVVHIKVWKVLRFICPHFKIKKKIHRSLCFHVVWRFCMSAYNAENYFSPSTICLTPNCRFSFRAGVSLNIHSFIPVHASY